LKHNSVEKLSAINTQTVSLINMISSAVKTKSIEVKDKVKDYITHTSIAEQTQPIAKHVSKKDKVVKLYRQNNQTSVFSLDGGDDDDDSTTSSQQREPPELVDIESWFLRSDILYKYECQYIDKNKERYPSLLLVSSTDLYILRKLPDRKTMANVVSRRPLQSIYKITTKKDTPEIITFRYATKQEQEQQEQQHQQQTKSTTGGNHKTTSSTPVGDFDKVYLPDAGDAIKNIKLLVVKALNLFDNSEETTVRT